MTGLDPDELDRRAAEDAPRRELEPEQVELREALEWARSRAGGLLAEGRAAELGRMDALIRAARTALRPAPGEVLVLCGEGMEIASSVRVDCGTVLVTCKRTPQVAASEPEGE